MSAEQPDFDFGAERCDDTEVLALLPKPVLPCAEVSVWREVPAALFLSWSAARQFAYCAARDEHSALHADSDAAWYRERAQHYKELIHEAV